MKESSLNWLKIAENDLKLAKILLKVKEPMGTVFHLHAAVEKILKGIAEEQGVVPPKIHDLRKLAVGTCAIKLEVKQEELLNLLNKAFIDCRYPVSLEQFEEDYGESCCKNLLKEVEVTFKWLKRLLESK